MSLSINKIEADLERGLEDRIEFSHTDRIVQDRAQPPLAAMRKARADPSPLGLLSFAACIFIFSLYGVHARGIGKPNLVVGMLIFYGGICQFLAGIMEFIAGNMFGATVFPSYAAFNLSLAMIWLPGSGILQAYTDPSTNELTDEFNQAMAMYLFAWTIITFIYTVAAIRSTWVLVTNLIVLDVEYLLLASWAATAGLWNTDLTPFCLPVFEITWSKL
ncbi:GPR1/FUN34/yaaH family domain-containing protein [Trichoderma sp. TUCIM 5745]